MNNEFIVKFNVKRVALYTLLFVVLTLVFLYMATLPSNKLPNAALLPKGGRITNKFIIKNIVIFSTLFFGVTSLLFMLLLIKIFLNRLILKNKEKEFLVVDDKGLLISNKWNIFSKPTLIEWKQVEDICVFDPKNYIIKGRYKYLENKIIALQLTQEFYNNSSFFKKIIYKFNRKLSNGYEVNINLNFSDCYADEVLDEIYEYCFINIQ